MPFSQQESVKRKAESTLKRLLKRRLSSTDPIDDTNICSLNVEGVWDQLSSDVKDAYNREHYDEAIEHSNDVIYTLKEMLIKALKLRMNLWQKKGDLGQQLKNAATLIENAPRDSVGYISAAQVYSMRGQQNRVIAITSEGMHNILKTDDGYETLKALYQNANARIAIRIDFLAQLPYDLACTIANYMPRKTRGACVKVSRTWRDRLLHYPKIWRICTIYPVSYDPTFQLLPKITTHIKELSIDCSSQLTFDKCMELLGYADFPNIQKLSVSTSK
ncbi:hypothetical protein INT45_003498 [Circinella minor]|uniref:F-box domain-containing protein n=1 Tax=Circinella minor TaxID=1195481 RepID=A0A8H7S6Q3_9FUNG|nr:hypothetical protein INT45_003498 [Circinella minor]